MDEFEKETAKLCLAKLLSLTNAKDGRIYDFAMSVDAAVERAYRAAVLLSNKFSEK